MPKQMHLALDASWTQVETAWRMPGSWVGRHYPDIGLFEDIARIAERGLFDMIFFGDGRTVFQAGDATDLDRLNRDLAAMQEELVRQLAADGVAAIDAAFERSGDLRYVGQGYELRVPFPDGPLDPPALRLVLHSFGELHRVEYGHVFEASPIEIVNIRVSRIGHMPKIAASRPTGRRNLGEAL